MTSGLKNYRLNKPDLFNKESGSNRIRFLFLLTDFLKKRIIQKYKKSGYAANRFQKPDWGHTR